MWICKFKLLYVLTQDDDDGNMYTSIQELRDEADELQLAMEECEKEGDVDKMNPIAAKATVYTVAALGKKWTEASSQVRCISFK